ncbi:DUF397 domain-containing protein [Streptomyces roseolilacinus]|uniref:DUF397 domain-containing protein n=1 Tax=Streptomyces roseolilacinus TaxID=66904 RepID=A0A918AVT7_9ACTN|nr:DUF397 domain-containing protein [Streptomyces roseolilacinus]GGP91402.1 hypothetical protein GCM10010249_06770 [Streptomyces roseolilacinus]
MSIDTSAECGSSLEWTKSSYSSSGNDADCVEVAIAPGAVHIRDSKDIDGPRLAVVLRAWVGFVGYASRH